MAAKLQSQPKRILLHSELELIDRPETPVSKFNEFFRIVWPRESCTKALWRTPIAKRVCNDPHFWHAWNILIVQFEDITYALAQKEHKSVNILKATNPLWSLIPQIIFFRFVTAALQLCPFVLPSDLCTSRSFNTVVLIKYLQGFFCESGIIFPALSDTTDIWGLWWQMQVSQAGTSNCIPHYSLGCNFDLSLSEIPARNYPCLRYLLLAPWSSYLSIIFRVFHWLSQIQWGNTKRWR